MSDDWPLLAILALILIPWAALAWLHGKRVPSHRQSVDDWRYDWEQEYYGKFTDIN